MPELLRSFDKTKPSGFEALLFCCALVIEAFLETLAQMKMPGARPGISYLPIRAAVAR
jgi:hypothetical protein